MECFSTRDGSSRKDARIHEVNYLNMPLLIPFGISS